MLGATSPTLNHVSRDTSSIATSVRHRSPGPKTIAPIIPVPSTPITPSTTSSSILPRRTPPPAAPQPLGRAPPSQAPLPLSRLDPPPAAGPTSTTRPGPSRPARVAFQALHPPRRLLPVRLHSMVRPLHVPDRSLLEELVHPVQAPLLVPFHVADVARRRLLRLPSGCEEALAAAAPAGAPTGRK